MHGVEAVVVTVAAFVQLTFEAASVLTVAAGGLAFIFAMLGGSWPLPVDVARRRLARCLIVALELQLAADIIATATHPTLEELAKLAAIALIRTLLNYFLVIEIRGEKEEQKSLAD